MRPREVIVVTDGDPSARRAVEEAGWLLGLRIISRSAGSPTPLSGAEIISLVQKAPWDPVLVMVDDHGNPGAGRGEEALWQILTDDRVRVLGVLAVASRTEGGGRVRVDASITRDGRLITGGVDKEGVPLPDPEVQGDTLAVLSYFPEVPVIGIGDIGKMGGRDGPAAGVPVTRQAIEVLLAGRGRVDGTGRAEGHETPGG